MKKKKSFGQHFLIGNTITKKIAAAINIPSGHQIIEIGPGAGALTKELIKIRPTLTLIEADRDLIPPLQESFPEATIIQADAAKHDFSSIKGDWLLFANLPYNAANAIIMNALSSKNPPTDLIVMVQKEVADRMLARAGEMSLLSVAIQLYTKPKRLFNVPPGAFSPPPKVDSTVVHLKTRQDIKPAQAEQIIAIAKAGFASKRKQLHKNLDTAGVASSEVVKEALEKIKKPQTARAQELSVEDWKTLSGNR